MRGCEKKSHGVGDAVPATHPTEASVSGTERARENLTAKKPSEKMREAVEMQITKEGIQTAKGPSFQTFVSPGGDTQRHSAGRAQQDLPGGESETPEPSVPARTRRDRAARPLLVGSAAVRRPRGAGQSWRRARQSLWCPCCLRSRLVRPRLFHSIVPTWEQPSGARWASHRTGRAPEPVRGNRPQPKDTLGRLGAPPGNGPREEGQSPGDTL